MQQPKEEETPVTLRTPSRRRSALLLVAAAALMASACTDSKASTGAPKSTSTSGASTSTSAGQPATGALGPPKAATGDPVTIGYSFDGATDAADNTDDVIGARAAVEYVNQYLGGIGGRPIKLDVCATNLDPAKATACATQFATDDVKAVLAANGGQAGVEFTPLAKQGIPVFLTAGLEASLQNNPHVFIVTGGSSLSLAAPAQLAKQAGAKHATLFVIDIPAAAEPLKAGAPRYYQAAGIKVDVVTVPPDVADFTPQVAAAMTKDPGQFYLVGTPAFCTRAINAIEAQNFTGQILGLQFCFDENSPKTVTKLKGIKVVAGRSFERGDAEYNLYKAVMDKFASKGVQLEGAPAAGGYSTVVAFARAVSGLKGPVTRSSITAAISSMSSQKKPLGGGLTFQCNKPDPTATSICSTGGLVATLDADGNYTNWRTTDASGLLKKG